MMSHLVLLGDSILDNASYVAGGLAVIDHVRQQLAPSWKATLCAVDGSVTGDIAAQLQTLPPAASHIVLSVGGNDALGQAGLLEEGADSVAQVMLKFSAVAQIFEASYAQALQNTLAAGLPVAACTIYYPHFPDAGVQAIAVAGLAFFNDAIIRAATTAGVPLIDLRLVCDEPSDYANDIEPSAAGGAKIASAIAKVMREHDFATRRTAIYF
jgi:lysophospholipase L1-like esterase